MTAIAIRSAAIVSIGVAAIHVACAGPLLLVGAHAYSSASRSRGKSSTSFVMLSTVEFVGFFEPG